MPEHDDTASGCAGMVAGFCIGIAFMLVAFMLVAFMLVAFMLHRCA